MAKANKGVSLGIIALVVISLTIIVAFGLHLNTTINPTLNTTYTKATDLTAQGAPVFSPSIVCTNTTTIQHSESASVNSYTTMTCFAGSSS